MPSQKGRDLLLKIGNGATPEVFTTIGAARTAAVMLNNQPVDATTMENAGIQSLHSDAGTQTMTVKLDGLFKNAAAEEALRLAAYDRTLKNYVLIYPNGDSYQAAFAVENYQRGGSHDGLETFSVSLTRSGAGTFIKGV